MKENYNLKHIHIMIKKQQDHLTKVFDEPQFIYG